MGEFPKSPENSRWDEFRTRPFQNYAVTLLALNSLALVGIAGSSPDFFESMGAFSVVFALQAVLAAGYFFTRLYRMCWFRIVTILYSIFSGVVALMGWVVRQILIIGFP